jgi:hypothetical protein
MFSFVKEIEHRCVDLHCLINMVLLFLLLRVCCDSIVLMNFLAVLHVLLIDKVCCRLIVFLQTVSFAIERISSARFADPILSLVKLSVHSNPACQSGTR